MGEGPTYLLVQPRGWGIHGCSSASGCADTCTYVWGHVYVIACVGGFVCAFRGVHVC